MGVLGLVGVLGVMGGERFGRHDRWYDRTVTDDSDIIPIAEEASVPKPVLPGGGVVVRPTLDDALDALCADLLIHARGCVRAFGDFHLAASGEAMLEPVLARLMYDPAMREFPWARTHLWMTWDRDPADAGQTYSEVVRELLAVPSDIPREQFHPYRFDVADPAADYEGTMREYLGWREKGHDRPDYALFSLDPRGLMCKPPPPAEQGRLVQTIQTDAGPGVCLSAATLSAVRLIAVVGHGQAAAGPLGEIAESWRSLRSPTIAPDTARPAPLAVRLRPFAGEVRWYLDHASAVPKRGTH